MRGGGRYAGGQPRAVSQSNSLAHSTRNVNCTSDRRGSNPGGGVAVAAPAAAPVAATRLRVYGEKSPVVFTVTVRTLSAVRSAERTRTSLMRTPPVTDRLA